MRKRIFEIIERPVGDDPASSIYDGAMLFLIVCSLIPLAFKRETFLFRAIDHVCVCAFIIDYLLRWITADYKYERRSALSFFRYPFSFMALVDLISILPSLTVLNQAFKLLRILRLTRAFRVLRAFRAVRHSRNFEIIVSVFQRSKQSLFAVATLAIAYVLVSALLVFNVEPGSFDTFFDAVYWATVSLTTVGYGDIYPVTTIGRIVTMVSSVFGIAIVALPAGILTAGYMEELHALHTKDDE